MPAYFSLSSQSPTRQQHLDHENQVAITANGRNAETREQNHAVFDLPL
jgi:hypothetical protein